MFVVSVAFKAMFRWCLCAVREGGRAGRLSAGQSLDDVLDSSANKENVADVASPPAKVDARTERDIEELSKLHESGAASVILKDLQRRRSEERVVDPRSASRTPNAAVEPPYRTRYESPIFACEFNSTMSYLGRG